MKKYVILVMVCIFLIPSVQAASTVTRSFSTSSTYNGLVVTVTLHVNVDENEQPIPTIYAIEETIPEGWTAYKFKDFSNEIGLYTNETGSMSGSNVLKWLYYSNTTHAVDKVYRYKAVAPDTAGTYQFSGIYMFENMQNEATIGGDNTVQVVLGAGDVNDDKKVDITDLSSVALQFGMSSSDTGFDSRNDINSDGTIDILDLVIVGKNYNRQY